MTPASQIRDFCLVEPDWLARHLTEPDLHVIDASWYLPSTGRDGRAEYREAHIPGAVHLDLSRDLADPDAPVRNTVASPEALRSVLEASGIGSSARLVVYDRQNGYSAGRVWWVLRLLGHTRVALLHGGVPRWRSAGHPLTDEAAAPPAERFRVKLEPHWICSRDQLLEALERGDLCVIDARSAVRFRGDAPETTLRAGHIPGARNVPYSSLWCDGDPTRFRDPLDLRALYEAAGVRFDRPVITSCGSGVTAALAAFVLFGLGHDAVAVYDGSWAEWGDDPSLPFETGAGQAPQSSR